MAITEYSIAQKRGLKAYRQDVAEGRNPYLKVLDETLTHIRTAGEFDLGLIEIPIDRIVGTKSAGRTKAFASNFMPLLEEGEFAEKWASLYRSHIKEGIREPVIACEFMNQYYIIEGNKRVSVLKYSGAATVPGYVTRIIPAYSEDKAIQIYYEFMEFSRFTGINNLTFSKSGCYHKICELVGKEYGVHWTLDERRSFSTDYYWFYRAYKEKGGEELPITGGDAFLLYLEIYGYSGMKSRSLDKIKKELEPLWNELEALPKAGNVSHILQPEQEPEMNMFQKFMFPISRKLTVGFLYHRTAETSSWTYAHDLGRIYLEETMGEKLNIRVYDGIETDEECLESLEQAIADGCTVIFTTSARFLNASFNACIRHPEIKILNCSMNSYSGHLRTYYGRIYEAKFLVGMLAGVLSRTDSIGYIADFPVFGTPASINAFALGVKMVNPTAKVHLAWSSVKNCDITKLFTDANISHICGRDMIEPRDVTRAYGLYDLGDSKGRNLAASIWNWGKFYQRILQTILNGNWKRTAVSPDFPTLNYWWGISSGMIDMITSKAVPEQTMKLIDLVKRHIINNEFHIFSGDLYDQNHVLRNKDNHIMTANEIMNMDWLVDNVVGEIPKLADLDDEAAAMVELQGFEVK
ncbi:MAG: BMP family ABC transporter substrate-binding protein [Lachnospiraceae bacterium]|nr:BMP family ABC transporter substrate-binding protein [Lachnospiraceae bacterium]